MRRVVIDTNVVLDLYLFADPRVARLADSLKQGELQWVGTAPMLSELARVLDYPHIAKAREQRGIAVSKVLQLTQCWFQQVPAPVLQVRVPQCRDPDDQMFVDLACAHQAILISKDQAVRALTKRLAGLNVTVMSAW